MILYLSYERVGVNAEYRRLKRGDEGGTYVVQRRDLEGALSDLFVLAPLCCFLTDDSACTILLALRLLLDLVV